MATAKKEADHGQAEVQAAVEKAEDKGYIGQGVDKTPDKEYSLQSGPDAPPLVKDSRSRVEQINADPEA